MDQTSQKIIDAAMELIMEIGYTAATTKDIARRAGVNECTIFRKKQSRWHPDLTPDDFSTWSGDMEEDLSRFAHSYMDKVTERFVKLSIGLRTPELADATSDGILSVPQTFRKGLIHYFGEMHQRGVLRQDNAEIFAMMFLALNFGFVFFKASFGEKLTAMTEDAYISGMVSAFVHGING